MEHLKTSDNIAQGVVVHCRGPIMDNLVQFEEDFYMRTEKWSGGVGVDRLSQTRPIPRSPDGDKNIIL